MGKNIIILILALAVLALAGVLAAPYLKPKEPTVGEKIDAALGELSKGAQGAAKALDGK